MVSVSVRVQERKYVRVSGKAGCIEDQLNWRETNLRKTDEKGIAVVNLITHKSMN